MNAVLELVARGERPDVVTASTGNHGRALAEAASGVRPSPARCSPRATRRATKTRRHCAAGRDPRRDVGRVRRRRRGGTRARASDRRSLRLGVQPSGHRGRRGHDRPGNRRGLPDRRPGGRAGGRRRAGQRRGDRGQDHLAGLPDRRRRGRIEPGRFAPPAPTAGSRPSPSATSLADGLSGNLEAGLDHVSRWSIVWSTIWPEVSEADIAAAIVGLLGDERLVVEGAGAVGAAALADGLVDSRPRQIVVIVSGGNIEPSALANLVTRDR